MSYKANAIKPKELAEILNTTVRRLQYLDSIDVIKAKRTDTNRRYYDMADVRLYKYIAEQRAELFEPTE